MKVYTPVSRKTIGEDRVAICPNFGCEYMKRVKPLKLCFLGFGKNPKCKNHHIPLVYVDERIGDFVDAALACLFDKAGIPPRDLCESVSSKYPDEFHSFINDWVYCITLGRGAQIISLYMDTISNAYLKQLTRKQIKKVKKRGYSKPNLVNTAIKNGMYEISIQYTRILKHLRTHSEVFNETKNLRPLSKGLQIHLKDWQNKILNQNWIINSPNKKGDMTIMEIKQSYDEILNVSICQCLLEKKQEPKILNKVKISAFDRFSAYYEFLEQGITSKFTKSDIGCLLKRSFDFKNYLQKSQIWSQTNITNNNDNSDAVKSEANMLSIRQNQMELKDIELLALENYKNYIKNKFPNVGNMKFISKRFLEELVNEIIEIQGELPDNKIAEILYGKNNGSEASSFATLKSNKNSTPFSILDEKLLKTWFLNIKDMFPTKILTFFNMFNKYELNIAEKRVFDLVNKWNSYCIKVNNLGLNMETRLFEFLETVLKGTLIENLSFDLSCNCSSHNLFSVAYKHLYRAVCPLCSRIEKSCSYQDFVKEAKLRDAKFKLTEFDFYARINQEFKKPRNEQQKVSEILFPFICNKHGEFNISMERIKDYENWCAECYHDSNRLTSEQIIARGDKYNFNLETPLSYIEKLKQPTRKYFLWSCKYHPSFKFRCKSDEYSLDQISCDLCSGGKITNERIMRYILSRLFHKDFGEKPTSLHKILSFNRVAHILPSDYNERAYRYMHFDAFAFIELNIGNQRHSLSVAGEYWDREHSSLEEYIDRFKHRTPRNGSFTNDYQHLKSSDYFKQELKNTRLIDIYIIVNHTIQRDGYLEFIISEFEQQVRKLFNKSNYRLRNIPNCNWRDLKQINKLRKTFGDIRRFI